jgi:periplasmic divalent cation tolerance protein
MEESDVIMMYVPVPCKETGSMLAREVIGNQLAACANLIGPVCSLYEWKGEFCEEEEWVLVLKTTSALRSELKGVLLEKHPYECPCLVDWPVQANPGFATWVQDQTL